MNLQRTKMDVDSLNECIFTVMKLISALIQIYFLVMTTKRCIFPLYYYYYYDWVSLCQSLTVTMVTRSPQLPPEEPLIRWVNHHLRHSNYRGPEMKNFDSSLKVTFSQLFNGKFELLGYSDY